MILQASAVASGGPQRQVLEWTIVAHPRTSAQEAAKLDNGGMSCSKYLQERGNVSLGLSPSTCSTMERQEKRHGASKSRDAHSRGRTSSNSNSKHSHHGSSTCSSAHHGQQANKALRAKIFASWLVKHMNVDCDDIVLDIAGGKGLLSMELMHVANVSSCTVMDPLVRKQPSRPKHQRNERQEQPPVVRQGRNRDAESNHGCSTHFAAVTALIPRRGGALPTFVAKPFANDDQTASSSLVKDATLLVGMHPDECTEDILDVALECDKSVAIVPCCVFPTLFPHRQLLTGDGGQRSVTSYEEFLDYLQQKDPRLQRATLPMEGKNQVIYLKKRH